MLTRRVALSLVAVFTVVVSGTSLIQTVRSFYRLDFGVSWIESGLVIDEVPQGSTAQDAGLVGGDVVVKVGGVPIDRFEDPAFILAGGDEHELTVRGSSGEIRSLRFKPPPPAINSVYLARTAVGVFGLACALYAVWTTRRREAATFLLLAAAALILGAVPNRIASMDLALQVVRRTAGAALPFLIVRFFAVFPERTRSMRLWDLLTLLAAGISGATAFFPNAEAWWQVAVSFLRMMFGSSLLFGITLHVRRWWATGREVRVRRQIEWAALGLFVGLAPFTFLVLIPRWMNIAFGPFSWLAVFPIAAVPLTLIAALKEYRLWDLEPITRDSVSATLVVVAGGFIFSLTNHLLLSYVGGVASLRNLFAFATGVLLVVLLQPVRLRVERFLDEWLHHGHPAPRLLLTQASRDLARVTDPRELLVRLSETLVEGLEFDLVATYLRAGGDSFQLIAGGAEGLPGRLRADVTEAEFPHLHEEYLALAGFTERIPLERVGTIHGLLYLGLRRGVFPLGSEGQEVVSALAAQAALSLESARYLDDLRRQAEEYRLLHANTQRIIESSAAAILVCDATARILSANTEAAGVFGREAQALVGLGLASLVDLPEEWHSQLPVHAVNTEARTLTDPPRRVILAISVLELDSGSFNGRVVVLQDVTELRELQDRMRDQERLVGLGRLASGLAHEINTPLTGISSFAQMLGEMTPEDDPRSALVEKLVDQSFRVSRIVANLREVVRGSSESRIVLDLGGVAIRSAQDAARSLGAGDRLEIAEVEESVMVWASPGPLDLAVANLVRNAFEASPPNGRVRFAVAAGGDWAEIRVEDSGSGIPDEARDHLFEPFFSTKTERGGTGLGLSITRDMIAQLEGKVALENLESGGVRATIRLNRWQESEASS
ncbi:MAG: nitrogen regulation protein NR(II) [Thermoanaerobaculales bacterium]